jgi:hypothetical protein
MEIKVNMREIRKILEEDFDINRLNSWKNDVSNSLEKIYNIELMKFDKLYTLLNNIKFIQDREINNYDISNINEFAYDGCHKIYLIEDEEDKKQAIETEYMIMKIEDLPRIWAESCSLRFINNWKLTRQYVGQFEKAEFKNF